MLIEEKMVVAQLRVEALVKCIKTSEACKDLIYYCEANKQSDVLVTGFSGSNEKNPFDERSAAIKCQII